MQQNKNKRMNYICLIIGVTLLAFLISGCGSSDDKVVAKYEGGEVTQGQFDQYKEVMKVLYGDMFTQLSMIDPNFDESILSQMIGYRILNGKASDEQRKEAKEIAESDWNQFRIELEQEGRLETLDQQMESAGVKDEDLINFYADELVTLFYYRDQVKEEDLQTYYDELLEENEHVFDRASVRHILIQTYDPQADQEVMSDEEGLARAEEVRQKLLDGETFDDLVGEYSDDLASVPYGGLIEDADVNRWVENFKKAALELPLNEISEPVKTEFGYHVMMVESRRTVELDEIKDGIRTAIAQEERQRFLQEELPGLIDEDSVKLPKEKA